MPKVVGRSVGISVGRRVICDLMQASAKIPLIPMQKQMNVERLLAARLNAMPRPSWCAIFTKAYAKVVAARPKLRRAYLTFPWERLYEYTKTTVDIAMNAEVDGEDAVVFVPLNEPEMKPLLEIDRHLTWCKEKPIERLSRYRKAARVARLPRVLRQWIWWYHLNVSAAKRSRYVGTFGVSSMANWGVDSLRPISPCTTLLHYGVIDRQGNVTVRLTFDHRVLDGAEPSLALSDMEQVLNTEIVAELTASLPLAA